MFRGNLGRCYRFAPNLSIQNSEFRKQGISLFLLMPVVEATMQSKKTSELPDRFEVVVHPEVDVSIVFAGESGPVPHDQQRSALLSPAVATGSLSPLKGGEQPFTEFSLSALTRSGEGVRHGFDNTLSSEQISLNCEVFPSPVPSPCRALAPRMDRDVTGCVDHRDLPHCTPGIFLRQLLERECSRLSSCHGG